MKLTVFDAVFPARRLADTLEIMGQMMSRPLFADFSVERAVVTEEIQDELDEQGRDIEFAIDGKEVIKASALVPADLPAGEYELALAVTVQACDDKMCLAPAYLPVKMNLTVE